MDYYCSNIFFVIISNTKYMYITVLKIGLKVFRVNPTRSDPYPKLLVSCYPYPSDPPILPPLTV